MSLALFAHLAPPWLMNFASSSISEARVKPIPVLYLHTYVSILTIWLTITDMIVLVWKVHAVTYNYIVYNINTHTSITYTALGVHYIKLCALLSTNSYLNAPEFGSCSKEECTWIYGKYSKLEYSAEGGLVFLVEKLGTARQLVICPIWLLESETSLLRNSGCVSALLYWLIRRAEAVSCSQTAFIWKAVVWKWSFRLHETAHLVLGTLQLPAKKTILLFIQGKDGAAYMHKKKGNLHYHLVYITRPFWFLFWALSKAYTSNIAVVTCTVTMFCRHKVFEAPGFDMFAIQWDSVNSNNERCYCAL